MNDTTTVAAGGLATDETNRLISSDRVEGVPVYNPKGERLGKVHHLMIDKYTGQSPMRTPSRFLHCKYHPLPKMLTYTPSAYVSPHRNKLKRTSYTSLSPNCLPFIHRSYHHIA